MSISDWSSDVCSFELYPVIYVRKTCIRYHVGIILKRQRSHLDVAVELDLTARDVHRDQILISQPTVFRPNSDDRASPGCACHKVGRPSCVESAYRYVSV